jgi:tetratricopeptide (TPR) repeat protein
MDPASSSSFARPPEKSVEEGRRRRVLAPWFLVLLLFAGVFGPCAAVQAPQEVGRWHLAQAVKLRVAGEKKAASEKLAEAMRWLPRSAELIITRAEWQLEEGQREEALAEANRVLDVDGESYESLLLHAQFLQNAGEFKAAVEDWEKIVRLSEVSGNPPLATAKNGLAYAQALAEVELGEALENANEALQREADSYAILDTRAYIDYLQAKSLPEEEAKERLTPALKDMDVAVKTIDKLLAQANPAGEIEPKLVKTARDARPKAMRDMDPTYANLARSGAVLHYHRALILEALGRKKEATAERAVVERLIGRPPDATLF